MPSSDTSSILYRIGQSVTNKIADEAELAGGWQEIKAGTTSVSSTTYISLTDSIVVNDVVAFQSNAYSLANTAQIHVVSIGSSTYKDYGNVIYSRRNTSSVQVGTFTVWLNTSTSIGFTGPQYFYNGSTTEYADTIYIGKIWKLTGRTGA